MFLRERKNRVGAAVALAAVLAMALAVPAGAAPWGGFGEAREIVSGFLPRVLAWITPAPKPGILKCDHGATIDPNGCPKAAGVFPAVGRGGMRSNDGSRIAPDHSR
jgi:hypothetical protein